MKATIKERKRLIKMYTYLGRCFKAWKERKIPHILESSLAGNLNPCSCKRRLQMSDLIWRGNVLWVVCPRCKNSEHGNDVLSAVKAWNLAHE